MSDRDIREFVRTGCSMFDDGAFFLCFVYEYNSLQWLGGDSYVCAPTKLDEASIAVLIDNV